MAETGRPDIQLFVSCHKEFPVPNLPLLHPIHVGAALSDERIGGYLRDDSGENISRLNRRYCELTGQYWVWKNVEADYYGFFHYRRGGQRPGLFGQHQGDVEELVGVADEKQRRDNGVDGTQRGLHRGTSFPFFLPLW